MALLLQDADARLVLTEARVVAESAWCRAQIGLELSSEELPRLATGLRRLHQAQSGSFLWANDGGEVRIEVAMAKRGEVHWSVRLQAPPDFLHELRMVFVGRQDDLQRLADAL